MIPDSTSQISHIPDWFPYMGQTLGIGALFSGGSGGGAPPLFADQIEARRVEKICFGDPTPLPLI